VQLRPGDFWSRLPRLTASSPILTVPYLSASSHACLVEFCCSILPSIFLEQAEALWDGGSDLFLVETIFDTLNAKAAIFALERFFEDKGTRIPVLISGTIVDRSGRTLSGQTNEAFWLSIKQVLASFARRFYGRCVRCTLFGGLALHPYANMMIRDQQIGHSWPHLCAFVQAHPFAVGLNCALGASDMQPYIDNLSKCADCYVFAYPNAGLPNAMGGYDQKVTFLLEQQQHDSRTAHRD